MFRPIKKPTIDSAPKSPPNIMILNILAKIFIEILKTPILYNFSTNFDNPSS